MTLSLPVFLLALGLAARATRLVVDDAIAQPLHLRVLRRALICGTASPSRLRSAKAWTLLHDLISCPWCIGFWLSGASVLSAYEWGTHAWWQLAAAACSISYVVGIGAMAQYVMADED